MKAPVDTPRHSDKDHGPGELRVRVLDTRRRPLAGAAVRLSGAETDTLELRYDAASTLHTVRTRLRGAFRVTVSAQGFEPQERTVRVNHAATVEEFVLGKKGLPYYYRGRVRTPFEPRGELIAVTLRETERDAAPQVERLAAQLELREEQTHEQIRRNQVRVFRLPARMPAEARQRVFDRLRAAPGVQLAGPVVEMFDERLVYLTSQFIVKFAPAVTRERAEAITRDHGFRTVRPVRVAGNAFLVEGEPRHDYRLLDAANALAERDDVEYAEPNAVMTSMVYAVTPPDFLVAQQWHLPIVRLPDAWQSLRDSNPGGVMPGMPGDRTFGHEDVQVVVFDTGVQSVTVGGVTSAAHPDFQGSVTSGASKVTAFYDAVNVVANNDVVGSDHGMGCAGVVAALANNPSAVAGDTEGVAGAAGNCRIIAVRAPFGLPNLRWADAFVWMAGMDPGWTADGVTYPLTATFPPLLARGADVHTNSVRIPDVGLMDDALDFLATYGRGGRGMVSFLAAGNTAAPISNPANNTIADHPKALAIAASINTDVRSGYSCFDPTIDVCAPSSGDAVQAAAGAPGKVTADTVGGGNLAGATGAGLNYRNNFGGTSSATPLAAGVGALMLSISPDLNWVQVRDILRATAVKIDAANTDPVGQWTLDAMSNPVFSQWYGYGRVDAAAAVEAARDHALASDVVIRDNLGDTGAVPSGGWHADSPDIWVSPTDDPIPAGLAYGTAGPHLNPVRGQDNFVYLRVKNTGTAPTGEVYLRALIVHFPGFEFRYPAEWQPSTPPSSPVPAPLVPGSYLIGEERIDALASGADVIVKMRWEEELVPPESVVVAGVPVTWHPCLLAEVSPHDGPGPSPGSHDVKRYNDLAHKNIAIDNPVMSGGFSAFGVVAGTSLREGVRSLVVDRSGLDPRARVFVRVDDRKLMREWLALARRSAVEGCPLLPWLRRKRKAPGVRVPGLRVVTDQERMPKVSVGRVRGRESLIFEGGGADALELPLPLAGARYVPLAIGIAGRAKKGLGVVRATQRLADGELSPGYEFRI